MSSMVAVPFYPGDGTTQTILVSYVADGFPRDQRGRYAFCHGDPCAEQRPPDSPIAQFRQRCPRAETCPCFGRAS